MCFKDTTGHWGPSVYSDGHFLDKNWVAIDPNPNRIYVSYTDFDDSGESPGCGKVVRTAID